MNSQPTDTSSLDTFEAQLLSELQTVREQSIQPPAEATVQIRRRRRLLVAAAAVAVAGVGAASLVVSQPAPAYAVDRAADGSVTVTVDRLADADKLTADLAKVGIKANVTYTDPGKVCADGRYTETAAPGSGTWEFMAGAGGNTMKIPADAIGSDKALVLTTTWTDGGKTWSVSGGYAKGPVGACVQVPAPDLGAGQDVVPPGGKPTSITSTKNA